MVILTADQFDTLPISATQSAIILGGVNTSKTISGTYFELCVKHGHQYLVLMTDDVPDEDMLHISLLDGNLNVIDEATIGTLYATGSFRDCTLIEPNTISFHFIDEKKWCIELLDQREWRIPFLSSPASVSRKHAFRQYFRVSCHPKPIEKTKTI